MGVVVTAGSGRAFTPAPAGVHLAVACDVIDMGMVSSTYEGKTTIKHKVRIVWQVSETNPENGKRFAVSKRYTASLHEKSTLRKDLQSWRGRAFTGDELKGFDLDNVLGKCCLLNIVHNEHDGQTYANVDAIMPPAKGMPKLEVVDYVREKDRPKDDPPPVDGDDEAAIQQAIDESVPF